MEGNFRWLTNACVSDMKVGEDYCGNMTKCFLLWKSPAMNTNEEKEQLFSMESRNVTLEMECERIQTQLSISLTKNNAMEEEIRTLRKQMEQNKTMSTVGFDLKAQMDEVIKMRASHKERDASELARIQHQLDMITKDRDELQKRVVDLLQRGGTSGASSQTMSYPVPYRRSFGDEPSPSSSPRPSGSRKVSMSAASSTAQSLLSHREYDMVRNAAIRVSLSADHTKGVNISHTSILNNNALRENAKILLGQNQGRTRQIGRYPDELSDFASDSGASEFISASSVASNLPTRSRCNSTLSQQQSSGRDTDIDFGVAASEFEGDCMLSDYGSSVFDADKSEANTRVSVPFSDFGVAPHKLFEFVNFMGR